MNMYKLLITISFLLLSTALFATVDFTEGHSGKRFIINAASSVRYGLGGKLKEYQLFFLLLQEENKIISSGNYVEINLGVYDGYFDKNAFVQKHSYTMSYAFGKLTLNIVSDNPKLVDILTLIFYGLNHISEIKKEQKELLAIDFHSSYGILPFGPTHLASIQSKKLITISSISQTKIDSILKTKNPLVSTLLKRKLYRELAPSPTYNGLLDYYTQNDSFYFFDNTKSIVSKFKAKNYIDAEMKFDTLNQSIKSFPHLYNVITDKDHYLIFITPDSFYHYNFKRDELIGPNYLLQTGIERFDRNSWVESMSVNNNIITLKNNTLWGEYNLLYNIESRNIQVDSNTFPEGIKEELATTRAQKLAIEKEKRIKKEKAQHMVAMLTVILLINGFLIFTKRL
jgi:hypothetical protein